VNVYFFETSILFRVASVSASAIVSLKKTIDKLPDNEEFNEIKREAHSQYIKVREGLEIIKAALGGAYHVHMSGFVDVLITNFVV
jgi:hypothetical protein